LISNLHIDIGLL